MRHAEVGEIDGIWLKRMKWIAESEENEKEVAQYGVVNVPKRVTGALTGQGQPEGMLHSSHGGR